VAEFSGLLSESPKITTNQTFPTFAAHKQWMKKTIYFLIPALFYGLSGFCQTNYHSAIGIRIGTGYSDLFSASFKTFLSDGPGAIELNLGVKPATDYRTGCCVIDYNDNTIMSFSASYQYHVPITAVPGLQWFVGGGFTLTNTFSDHDGYSGFGLGLFPTGGADYKFGKIPLDVSVDLRPTFRVVSPTYYNYDNFYFPDFGFSARFTIN
jgi:hypothetical protein